MAEIPTTLLELKQAAEAARAAYMAHNAPADLTLEQKVGFDLEECRLLRASSDARIAYTKALEAFATSEAA